MKIWFLIKRKKKTPGFRGISTSTTSLSRLEKKNPNILSKITKIPLFHPPLFYHLLWWGMQAAYCKWRLHTPLERGWHQAVEDMEVSFLYDKCDIELEIRITEYS